MYVCMYVYRTPAAVRSSMALRTSGRMGTEEAAMPRNTCAAHGNALGTTRRRIREERGGSGANECAAEAPAGAARTRAAAPLRSGAGCGETS